MRTRPDVISTTQIGENKVHRDEAGYLIDPEEWNFEVASYLGVKEGIELNCPVFSRHPAVSFVAVFQSQQATAARY